MTTPYDKFSEAVNCEELLVERDALKIENAKLRELLQLSLYWIDGSIGPEPRKLAKDVRAALQESEGAA